jgi:hypothetical protein
VKLRQSKLSIPAHGLWLTASLSHAPNVRGLILLLQSSGTQRNTAIPCILQQAGYATLALDLLTAPEEARDPDARFNVAALTERILASIDWIDNQPGLVSLPLGIFASDTACAAGIRAAAHAPHRIGALCILAGRPDLAGASPLRALQAPTCFIVARNDPRSAILRQAHDLLATERDWQTITTEAASDPTSPASGDIAARWMNTHLPTSSPEDPGVALFPSLAAALSFASPFQPPPEK